MATPRAPVVEVFSGVQGEGLYAGERQLFVRLAGCNLRCSYCDTPQALVEPAQAAIETAPGARTFKQVENPFTPQQLVAEVNRLCTEPHLHQHVVFTGGEPLLHAEFLLQTAPLLCEAGHKLYLETNSTLPEAMKAVAPYMDVVAADVKLHSVGGTGDLLEVTRHCFEQVPVEKLFAKLVVSSQLDSAEFEQALQLLAELEAAIPLILQPVSTPNPALQASETQLLDLQAKALRYLRTVRVIPQLHKAFGWR